MGFLTATPQSSVLQHTFPDVTVHQVTFLLRLRTYVLVYCWQAMFALDGQVRPRSRCQLLNSHLQVFLEQFESVTDMAPNPETNLTAVLYQLSGVAARHACSQRNGLKQVIDISRP